MNATDVKAARAADRARGKGKDLPALHGVPITIKEAFDVAGLKTTSSHPPLADNVAREDASLVARLRAAGLGQITTEIIPVPTFYYAEDYHQQYLAKNPNGYCGLAGTGVSCPIGLGVAAE